MATGPLDLEQQEALAQRVADAEARVEELTEQLAAAYERIGALEEAAAGSGSLSLFDDGGAAEPGIIGDGSDPRILSMILGATAIVAAMVTVLAVINGKILTPFGVVMIALTVALAWSATRARVHPVDVSVVRGIVFIEQGQSTYRFEIRRPEVAVEMVGQPGSPHWAVQFPRRGMEPFTVDASMVDPVEFVEKLREYRPEL